MKRLFVAAAFANAVLILSLLVPAQAQDAMPAKIADTAKGKALVDQKGMTLYVFDKDTAGKSNCSGSCIQNWPAFTAAGDAKTSGDWSIVAREDGAKQWAYKGKPLYTWVKDSKPGDATGDGVGGVWHIARP